MSESTPEFDDDMDAASENVGFVGEMEQGAAPPAAKRNFMKVALLALGAGTAVGGTIAGPTYYVYSNKASQATESQEAAEKAKLTAEQASEAATVAANEAMAAKEQSETAASTANQQAQEALQQTEAAKEAETAAIKQREEAMREAEEATRLAAMDRQRRVEAETLSSEAGDRVNAARAGEAQAKADRDQARQAREALRRIVEELETSIATASLNDPAGRKRAISALERLLLQPEYQPTSMTQAKKRMDRLGDLGRINLTHAVSIQPGPQRQAYAKKAIATYTELGKLAQKIRDQSLVLDSIYGIGRAHELGSDLDAALRFYENGVKRCENSKLRDQCARFLSAVVRIQLEQLGDLQDPTALATAPSKTFVSLLQPQARLQSLETLLAKAETASLSNNVGSRLSLGQVYLAIARYYASSLDGESGNATRIAMAYSRAIDAFREGISMLPINGEDRDLQGALAPKLYDAYVRADAGLREFDAKLASLETYKQLHAESLRRERALAGSARELARKFQLAASMPADVTSAELPALQSWLVALTSQVSKVKDDRDQLSEADVAWAKFAQVVARNVEFSRNLPPQQQRVAEQGATKKWVGLLARQASEYFDQQSNADQALADTRHNLGTMRFGESAWADFHQQVAAAYSLNRPLAAQAVRWTTMKKQTETGIDDVLYKVAQETGRRSTEKDEATRLASEKWFGLGLHYFFEHEFQSAIEQFNEAIELYPRDARYYYFRGMARKCVFAFNEDPFGDMTRGRELEDMDSPSSQVISQSLSRIQGETRAWLEDYRRLPLPVNIN